MPDVPVPKKPSEKQFEMSRLQKAASGAKKMAVSYFREEMRLYDARKNMKMLVMEHVPKHSVVSGHVMSLAVAYSQEPCACTATVWFDLPDGSYSNKDRDRARILLAHVLGIAIYATFFDQANGLTASFLNAIKKPGDLSKLAKEVAGLSVNDKKLSVVNFPGPFVSTSSQPASTHVRVGLTDANSLVATGALQDALKSFDINPKLYSKQISTYILAAFIQVLVGYGYAYVGSIDLGSKSQSTVRTKLCVSLDDRLHGPPAALFHVVKGERVLWSEADYGDYVYELTRKENLEMEDSIVTNIFDRVAIAVVVRSIDALDQTTLKFLYENTTRPYGHITQSGVLYVPGPSDAFLEWVEAAATAIDKRFLPRLNTLRGSGPCTGISKTVCHKLLNGQKNFEGLERIYLKYVFLIDKPKNITRGSVISMLKNNDERYSELRACNYQLQEMAARKQKNEIKSELRRRTLLTAKEAADKLTRVPIVKLALFGWENKREPLGQEQLKYLLDDLKTTNGYTPMKYISRDVASNTTTALQTLAMRGDGAAFLTMLCTEFPVIQAEVEDLRIDLMRRACDAILAAPTTLTTFDLLVVDYLKHVEEIEGFDADDAGRVEQVGLDALYASNFAETCKQIQKSLARIHEGGPYEEAGPYEDDHNDIFVDKYGVPLGPLKAVRQKGPYEEAGLDEDYDDNSFVDEYGVPLGPLKAVRYEEPVSCEDDDNPFVGPECLLVA